MKSLILTSLYLFKDTLYRWKERPSSLLSRILVVFFLSVCALSVVATYVISTQTLRNEVRKNGGDMVIMSDFETKADPGKTRLMKESLSSLCDAEMVIVSELSVGDIEGKKIPIVAYSDESLSGLKDLPLQEFPYLALMPRSEGVLPAPSKLTVEDFSFPIVVREMPSGHVLAHVYSRGVILVPEGVVDLSGSNAMVHRNFLVRVKEMSYVTLKLVEDTLNNIGRLDGTTTHARSSASILKKLESLLDNQTECRAGFSLGIAFIVGILLTALASMEFRQNEYVYTLMKSFGVQPFMLVMTFIAENLFVVLGAFVLAVVVFIRVQDMLLREFFKGANPLLGIQELLPEIILLSASLVVCVLVSSVPIMVSAYRELGRVLK